MNEQFQEDLKVIRESQIRMEADLKYHIKRTDLLEATQVEFRRDVRELHELVGNLRRGASIKDIAQIGAWIAAIVVGTLTVIEKFFRQ